EALLKYQHQDPFVFEIFDWARPGPDSARWALVLPYSSLSNYLTTITVGGLSYQGLTIYNSTRDTGAVSALPTPLPNAAYITVWENSVYLFNYNTGSYDLIYQYRYDAKLADQKTLLRSWGPIFEAHDASATAPYRN